MTQGKVYGGLKLNNYMPGKNDEIHYFLNVHQCLNGARYAPKAL